MTKDYSTLIDNVKRRTNPEIINESILLEKKFSDELRNVADKKILEYIKRSMRGVELRYTERTIEAGNNVKKHLKDNNPTLDYKFQGSVMCNTHIVGYSDIDLVQLTNSFYSHVGKSKFKEKHDSSYLLNESQKRRLLEIVNSDTFVGDINTDLIKIRLDAENVLISVYKYVETGKPKSIEVETTNPKRKVDVVTASWFVNVNSVLKNEDTFKGIQIYDKDKGVRLPVDYPFLKIELLNEKDKLVNGRLKKMIRFLKNLKYDSDYKLDIISSFIISSMCYNIPSDKYEDKTYYELVLVLYSEVLKIMEDTSYRNSITSIDGSEYIFQGNDELVTALGLFFREIHTINQDLITNLPMSKFL